MLPFKTKYFGEMECAEDAVFRFGAGLPGFESETEFVFLDRPTQKPLVFMQSVRTPETCFIALPVLVVDPHYCLAMPDEDLAALDLAAGRQPRIGDQVLCLALLTALEGVEPTANLRSPIVVNLLNRKGVQSIQLDASYSFQQPLLSSKEPLPCS